MPEFNQQQKEAVFADNPSLLCSAGAGSGKTTVMTESIVRKLREHKDKDISGFLIITFTTEAAANMKRKIRQRLLEEARGQNAYAVRALGNLENAAISTIHAFCRSLIASYFYAIDGMSPKFDILEEARLDQLFQEAYEDSLEDLFRPDQTVWTQEEVRLIRDVLLCFSQTQLPAMLRSLYDSLMGIPDPFAFLDRCIEGITLTPEENAWAQEILFASEMDLAGLEGFLRTEKAMLAVMALPKCEAAAEKDEEAIRHLLAQLQGDLSVPEKIAAIEHAREQMPGTSLRGLSAPEKEWYDRFRDLRNEVKGSRGILAASAGRMRDLLDEGQLRDNRKIRRNLSGIAALLKEVAARFRRRKLEEGGIDYADMEQMAYELMKREDVRESVRENITDIYVDECQDVSQIQHAIIGALAGGEGRTITRVGDIKQSIYGFRSAAPGLMERDIQSFSEDPDAPQRKIFFQKNYRSGGRIIECVNEVFDASMDRRISEIDYAPQDHLKACVPGDFGPVEVLLLARDAAPEQEPGKSGAAGTAALPDTPDAQLGETAPGMSAASDAPPAPSAPGMLEAQCEAAGRRILELVSSGYSYRDIVILVRNARTDAPAMTDFFRQMHIPVYYDGDTNFFGLTEISSFLALLSVIDNHHTDVELIGALRSVPFAFSDDDLARIRSYWPDRAWFYEAFRACCDRGKTALDKRCAAARDQILAWRARERTLGVSDFLWRLMRESGIYAVRGAYPDGKLRQLNLDSLYQRAVVMEKRGVVRLSGFLREIGTLQAAKSGHAGDAPSPMGEGDNFVRLMTIHKSKGLEFPVVILMNLQRNLRAQKSQSLMKIQIGSGGPEAAPLGVYVPAVSRENHTKRDTYGTEAFRIRSVRTSIAEDTRLLYVGMTRAMQKLILVGHFSEKETALWAESDRLTRIWKTRSMLDLIMPAVLRRISAPAAGAEGARLLPDPGAPVREGTPLEAARRVSQSGNCSKTGCREEVRQLPDLAMQIRDGVPRLLAPGTQVRGGPWLLEVRSPRAVEEPVSSLSDTALDSVIAGLLAGKAPAPGSLWQKTASGGAPLKTSVTSLLRTRLAASSGEYAPEEEEETVEVKRRSELPGFLLSQTPPRPAFMEEAKATPADIGSLTHRFLRLVDLAPFRGGNAALPGGCLTLVSAQIEGLKNSGVLTAAEAKAIYARGAAAFLESSLGRRLAAAQVLHREWPFTMQIREDSPTMVQGIVDAAFLEDGQWILIDYKTDRDTRPEVFVPRHEQQMNWYRLAVERLTGLPVREMWLFALRSGQAYAVRRQ